MLVDNIDKISIIGFQTNRDRNIGHKSEKNCLENRVGNKSRRWTPICIAAYGIAVGNIGSSEL